jgi:hypothetical protein
MAIFRRENVEVAEEAFGGEEDMQQEFSAHAGNDKRGFDCVAELRPPPRSGNAPAIRQDRARTAR